MERDGGSVGLATMKIIFTVMLFGLVTRASAQTPMFPVGAVKEGVYFLNGWAQTTIVELKNGQFRYWFSSDMKGFGGEVAYPQTGKYTTNGGTVKFVTLTSVTWIFQGTKEASFRTMIGGFPVTNIPGINTKHESFGTNEWTFINYQGQTTLWRPEALKYWEEAKKADGYGILFPTDRKPEEIWEHKGWQPQKKSSP